VLPLVIRLSIVAVEAEHSRDSSSRATSVTIAKGEIVVQKTRNGRGGRPSAEPRKRKLAAADERKVNRLLEGSGLLKAKDMDEPLPGPGLDYTFDMKVTIDGQSKSLHLHGPVSDWRGEGKKEAPAFARSAEYQAAVKLVDDLEELASP